MKLNDLVPNEGSKKRRRRVGRGTAAGQGKTSGRGMKGQNSRAGSGGQIYKQGGNLPLYRRLPFLRGEGFRSLNRVDYSEVNVGQLANLKADTEVTPELLAEMRLIKRAEKPVVILGNGEIKAPLKIQAHRVTRGAREKIEAAGGTVEIIS